jgi:hypothetical protein
MRVIKGLVGALLMLPLLASAEEIGQVSTVFKMVGPNDRIVVEAFDDPKVDGVTCYLPPGGAYSFQGAAERRRRGVQRADLAGVQDHAGRAIPRQEAQYPGVSGL